MLHESDAHGRSLVIVWFHKHEDTVNGFQVNPVAGRLGDLHLELHTIAEIARAAGFYPQISPDDTAAQVESVYESNCLALAPLHYESNRIGERPRR